MALLHLEKQLDSLSDNLNRFHLEDELDSFNMLQENEIDNFRESVEYNNPTDTIEERSSKSALYDLVYQNTNTSSANFYADRFITKDNNIIQFSINRCTDYINDLYLEFTLDGELEILSIEDKLNIFNILNSTIFFDIYGRNITTLQLAPLLAFQLCNDKVITKGDNTIQIPIFNFNTFKTGIYSGLPLVALQRVQINVYLQTKYNRDKIKLLVMGGHEACNIRRETALTSKEMLIFTSKNSQLYQRYISENIIINLFSMALIVFCIPKDPEQLSLDPNITSIQLYNHQDNVELEFNSDNILSMEILGVKIYLLPLCKQFDSWENISNVIKYPNKFCDDLDNYKMLQKINITADDDLDKYKISQKINITADDDLDNYKIFITAIDINILSISGGWGILKYTSI